MGKTESLIEARCGSCAASEFESSLGEHPEGAEEAAEFFNQVHDRSRKLLKEDPGLLRKFNILSQELDDLGPRSERASETLGNYTRAQVSQFAVNCALMQANGACRTLNPLKR